MAQRKGSTLRAGIGLLAVSVVLGAAACEPESDSSATTAPIYVPLTTTVPPTVPSTTTTTVPVDLLGSCVELAKFQAFVGNEFWGGLWEGAGQTDEGMRAACDYLAATVEPGWLEQIDRQWQTIRVLTDPAPTTTRLP